MSAGEYYVGVDIGGTSTKMGIIGDDGVILRKRNFESNLFDQPDDFLNRLSTEIEELVGREIDFSEVRGIGIGAPTANYHTGRIEGPANLKWSEPLDVKSYLEVLWGIDVFVTNDANLAALGELYFGEGQRFSDLVVVTIGTGIGAGIISKGALLHGVDDLAGELGHLTIIPDGRQCSCGKKGCLEAYVSVRGIQQTYCELTDCDEAPSPLEIYKKATQHDKSSSVAIGQTGYYLGLGLANLAVILAPQCIVLSGGLANMGEALLAPVQRSFEQNLLTNLKGKVRLSVSTYKDNELSLLGTAALVRDNFMNDKILKAANK